MTSEADDPALAPSPPEITRVRYDGTVVTVSWLANPNPATTFVIHVYADGVEIAAVDAGHTTNGWLPVDLPAGGASEVEIEQVVGGSSRGRSQLVPIVQDRVAVTTAETNPATGLLTLAWAGAPGDEFRLRIAVNGAPPGPEEVVAGNSASINPPQPAGCTAAASLARVLYAEDAVSVGPFGPGFAIPTGRPDLLAAGFDGAAVAVAWAAVAGATGYRVTVLRDGATGTQATVPSPATEAEVPLGVQAGAAYSAVVQAVYTTGTGPPSAPLALVLAPPTITAVTCDGATVDIAVTPPPAVTPTAYDVTLVRDGTPVATGRAGPATPLRLPIAIPLPPGAAYTVSVRARTGRTAGPAVTARAVVATPDVTAVVCGAELVVTAAHGALPAGTAIDAVVDDDGKRGSPRRVGPDGTATFPIPPGAAAVAVRGIDGIATGPWSTPVPAPTHAPVVTAARATGDRLALEWTGAPGATYRVALARATTVSHGTTATLPLAAGVATVTEIAGVAAGPAGTVDVVATGPVLRTVAVGPDRVVTIALTQPAPPVTSVQPVVRWDGTEVLLPALAATDPLVVTLPDDVPNAASVALRGIAGVAIGPPGNAGALLTVAPTGVAAAYDGTTVTVTWQPVADPAVDRYAVTLAAPAGDPVVVVVTAAPARIPYAAALATAAPPAVTVAAMAGELARGLASAAVDLVTAAPVLTAADYDGADLRLAWTGAGPAYQVAVENVGVAGQATEVGGTAVTMPLAPGEWTAVVRTAAPAALGPPARVPLLTVAPALAPPAFDPVTRVARLAWPAVPGATGYTVVVRDGAEIVRSHDVTEPADTIPAATFATGGAYSVTVRATASSPARTVAGPPATTSLLTTAPAGIHASYDGATVRASWSPVAGASGYRVSTISGGVATVLGDTAGVSGAWPLSTDDHIIALVVQPRHGPATGAPSAPVPLFRESLFLGPSYVVPQAGPVLSPAPITLLLPELFAPRPPKVDGLPLHVTLAPTAPPPYAWTLTIPANSEVWTFTGRGDIVAAWTALVGMVQRLGATPYGIAALTEAASRAMPQTFAETLYFAYGLQFARGCVDLRPGVVLRVEYEGYQAAPGAQGSALSGYVTTAVAEYEVASYDRSGTWTNGLDAFLAALTQKGVTVPDSSSTGGQQPGGGGALDVFTTTMQAPFIRLVYPPAFLATTSPGSTFPQLNAVLLAGQTPAALDAATDLVRRGLPPGAGVAKAYFRGRTVVTALVRIVVDGVPRLVPLGTTVGNVLAGAARRPPTAAAPLANVTLRRPRAAAVAAEGALDDWLVRLDWSPADPGRLDLPLLHGDRLDLGAGG